MKSKPLLFYEVRLTAGASALLPALGLPAYAAFSWWRWGRYETGVPLQMVRDSFEIILPLAAGLSSAHLMTIEAEEDFDELRRSYPEPRRRLPLLRGVASLAFLLLTAVTGTIAYHWIWGPFDVIVAVLPSLVPALFLSGLSLLVGGISRSYWAASGVVMGYWFLELQTRGRVSGLMFLFDTVWPVAGVPYALNRALLAGVGFTFFAVNRIWYSRPKTKLNWRNVVGER